MKPIRVLATYTHYPHIGSHSGYPQILRHLDPSRIAVSARRVSDSDADWPLPETGLNRRLRRFGVSRGMAWYKLSDLAAELLALPASLANTIDIVHFLDAEHTGQFLQTWIRRSRISRVRTVATFHQPPELLEGLINPGAVRQLDCALVVSPAQAPFLEQFLPADRVHTLLHGIDTVFFQPDDGRRLDGTFRCITVGHWLRDWKALRSVVEMLGSQSDIEFNFVTDRETGLEGLPRTRFHRHVDDEGLLRLYQQADLLLLPLTNATANNSLLEGLACGLPVVATNTPSVAAYVGDGCATLVEENAPAALATAVLQLRDDDARRAAMSLAARTRAEALAWPQVSSALAELYSALFQRRLSAPTATLICL
jgi:glycosyltransferase involved in cell wall biosynthesis